MIQEATGLQCPACGCRELFVTGVRSIYGGRKRRRRECRHCGKIIITLERIADTKDAPPLEHQPEPATHIAPDPVPEPEPPAAADPVLNPQAGIFPPDFFDKKPKARPKSTPKARKTKA